MPQECAAQPGLLRMTLRQSGIPWRLLSDIDDEPLIGRCTLHMPILGVDPGACLLLDGIQGIIRPYRIMIVVGPGGHTLARCSWQSSLALCRNLATWRHYSGKFALWRHREGKGIANLQTRKGLMSHC